MFVVTVTFTVKEQHLDEFIVAVRQQAQNSLAREKDCHLFDVCVDGNNRKRIFLYEIYTDREAFDAHLETEHFLSFDALVQGWLEDKTVETWNRRD